MYHYIVIKIKVYKIMAAKNLDIHLEDMDDDGEKLELILDRNIPCALSIVPDFLRQGKYDDRTLSLIEDIVRRKGSLLGQQGNTHLCGVYHHESSDSNHENYCMYGPELNQTEQGELMQEGKETILRYLDISPELYVPPNHLFDETTLQVAEFLGYEYFAERGIVDPRCYARGRMKIMPEFKLGSPGSWYGNVLYTHYDKISQEQLSGIQNQVISFNELNVSEHAFGKSANRTATRLIKRLRDARRFLRRE